MKSDGIGLRVAASPVSGLIEGVSVAQPLAIAFTSGLVKPISSRSRNATCCSEWQAEQTSL